MDKNEIYIRLGNSDKHHHQHQTRVFMNINKLGEWISDRDNDQMKPNKHLLRNIACLRNTAPWYLAVMCMPIATSARRQGLQSVTARDLVIPRVRLVTYCSRTFSIAGPVRWNGLPDYLKSPDLSFDCVERQLKSQDIFVLCILGHTVLL